MTIPALSTADKLFICSYNIGSNIDHRKTLGIINEYTTFTSEYIDGFCWIPVNCDGYTENDHSWYWDLPDKDIVYVKVGVRVSSDGYLHAWLLDTQKVSELILWNTNYNTTHYAKYDKTVLHWCIEKMYQLIFGNTTAFIPANIKFQNYVSGATRLYLFGSYSNSLTNPLSYTIDHPLNVKKSSLTWYPNNYSTYLGDFIYSSLFHGGSHDCDRSTIYTDLYDTAITKAFLYDSGVYTDYTNEFNDNLVNDVILMPLDEELNDAFYFGHNYKFYELKLNIGTAGGGIGDLITWEYYGSAGWTQFFPTDGTNEFKNLGTNIVDFNWYSSPDPEYADELLDWTATSINGSNLYWIRARSNYSSGINDYTTSPLLTQGWVRIPEYWLNFSGLSFDKKSAEPVFYKYTYDIIDSIDITALCHPSNPPVPQYRNWEQCHPPAGFDHIGIGNNSGRNYTLTDSISPVKCDHWSCGVSIAIKRLQANIESNRKWVLIPAHCSDSGYGNQTDCETAGHTWIPEEYICDSTFTYDSAINYTYDKWVSVNASDINYTLGEAKFNGALVGDEFLFVGYIIDSFDIFNEYLGGDLDELRHHNFTVTGAGSLTNNIYTIYTKHVAVGLLTNAAPTINTSNWIITWGTQDYFSNWQTPDGLSARTPSVTNTPYIRPIIHHDEFSIITDEPVLGGFLYEPAISNAFLSRDPGTETKITYPVNNLSDFDNLFKLITSNAFLNRDPGTETKILYPVGDKTDFNYLVKLLTSNGFLNRDPGIEDKIEFPICDKADFSFLYKLIRPVIADLYHLELTGDDTKDGESWVEAWKSWTHAMQNTPDERTLLVEEGVYNIGETQVEPDNSIVIYLVKNHVDDVSTVTVTI